MIKNKIKPFSFLLPVLLVAVYPILFFYANNISGLSLVFLEKPLVFSVTISVFLVILWCRICGNKERASLIVTGLVFVFFSYGHLSKYLSNKLFIPLSGGVVLGPHKILLPLVFLLVVLFVYKTLKTKNNLSGIMAFLNIVLSLLCLNSAVMISVNEIKKNKGEEGLSEIEWERQENLTETPDVYHIILDGYARNDILKDLYDYDNSGFVADLEKMGFFVAEKARANYMHTYLSLPSTFNMNYLEILPEKYGKSPVDESVAKNMMFNNQALLKFKSFGYKTINFVSDWDGTNENYLTDVVFNEERTFKTLGVNIPTSESNMVFLQTTLVSPLIQEVWEVALRRKTLSVFEKMPDVAYLEGKKYILAHIMAPHPPYVFAEDGGEVNDVNLTNADEGIDRRHHYLNQLKFITKQATVMLKKIFNNSKSPPIIILQSDHGPASILGKREEWSFNYNQEAVKERASILYAVFLPNGNYEGFSETMTPINTYGLLFNKYFGENNELFPDKTYYTSYDEIYGFYDVTDVLDQLDDEAGESVGGQEK